MSEFIKIREVLLKYYEYMKLIQSVKSNDYAYRMYDCDNIKILEQILILHKLNIGIKDIQRILTQPDRKLFWSCASIV